MENHFVFQHTADGSPTLSQGEQGEWMHHRQSALEETLYIYGTAVDRVLAFSDAPSFVSVGLGLGYVELLVAASAVRTGKPESFSLRSFEASAPLAAHFRAWVEDAAVPSAFAAAYKKVADCFARHFDVPPQSIKACLAHWLSVGSWHLEGALMESTPWEHTSQGLLYDPFSAETNPALWTKPFLMGFLENAASPLCVFASYAATGDLKRALSAQHFRTSPRAGFAGKRECTLAWRP